MINIPGINSDYFKTPLRKIEAKVGLYKGSTFVKLFDNSAIKNFKIERTGEDNKFFGFGICQKLELQLIDEFNDINITKEHNLVLMAVFPSINATYGKFFVEDVKRDENTNNLTVIAYDFLYKAKRHTVSELGLASYTIQEFIQACATLLGARSYATVGFQSVETCLTTQYPEGANFEGTETIRDALTAIAEATQTIYYVDWANDLYFKKFSPEYDEPVLTITKSDYMTLKTQEPQTLTTIVSATELGDNVSSTTGEDGATQYVRDNPFWELREDLATLLDNAITYSGGLTITPFECEWRGNLLLEIGDMIELETKDGTMVRSYMLNDTLSYDGGLSQSSFWKYEDKPSETASNPTTLGEALNQTYARVDKANKQISMVASETNTNSEAIAQLQIDTGNISLSVGGLSTKVDEGLDGAKEDIETLKEQVSLSITKSDLTIEVERELSKGVDKVSTVKGFTFNNEGLTIEETNAAGERISETSTQITENGMTVYNVDNEAVLTANNNGVVATDLHARTYLIIGNNARFEDYKSNRTGCFWIGG